ncbi:MAG: hypothetical protein KIT84_12405 [Labilithrix sp.]|nr:hypothetical protein [Labilithrix sp.]MCW5811815.1 hypothetical protein [Labilithrix sp.]
MRHFAVVLVLFLLTFAAPAGAAPIPEPLKPWAEWALHGKEDALCPTLQGVTGGAPQCAWPARLELVLDEKRGTWKQAWHVDAKRAVPLPGDDKRWPLDVTVDGKRAVVVPQGGVPSVELEPGDHVVAGVFAWDSLPESIQVPPETALLSLALRGKAIDEPNRDAKGTVWLQKTLTAEEGERLDFVVHRKIVDEVPLLLTTRIVLNVAGRNREVLLGKVLPPGFVPMAIDAQLPARVEPDTRLRVQARPGTWTIEVVARSEGPVATIERPKPEGPWREGEEVWVFEARTNLRLVDVQGVSAIDPQQTSLPDEWKKLPAYPLALGSKLQLVERRRGDAEPPPDHLTLVRTMWLDFDGKALTVSDELGGNLRRASRLEMLAPTTLGRVAIDGKDQFITHLETDAARTGVEVRQGVLRVSADSRVVADPGDLPAVGWNHDFHSVRATLNLPPGFRLVHAAGVDDVPGTWVKHWTLLELFLALVLAIGAWRLWGVKWGALALVTFALTFPESGAPKYVLVAVFVVEALVRAIDRAKSKAEIPSRGIVVARKLAGLGRGAVAVALVLVTVPFLIQHVRGGLFPALAAEMREGGGLARSNAPADMAEEGEADVAQDQMAEKRPAEPPKAEPAASATAPTRAIGGKYAPSSSVDYQQFNANVYDPSSMVQTGPGRPRWSFVQVPLQWSGPVDRSQRLHLYLLTPPMNAALAVLRVLLVAALIFRVVPIRPRRDKDASGKSSLGFAVTAVLALFVLFPRTASAQSIPDKEVLDELAKRILETPACAPTCASSSRMLIEASAKQLRVRVEIEAAAPAAIPIPTSAQWSPEDVLLDGKPARALKRTEDGRVWIAVEKGWHQATLVGPLPDRELVQLSLPLKPHHVEAQAEGWRVEGIHEDGLADDNLQLTRVRQAGGAATLEPGVLPPFVRIERTLLVGLDWQVSTKVVRLSPVGTAIVLEVPLLKGESVTTADVRVAGGKAQLNMPPAATELSWKSVLTQASPVVLTAPKAAAWTELWRLDMSPIWHADFEGVPVVHAEQKAAGQALPEWRPWPGEVVTVKVSRPNGVTGNTLTIDESTYALEPGLRATDATLTMKLRSSRGAQHVLTLPESSLLESVSINGATQPIQQEGRKVTLPIAPGSQSVVLKWRMNVAMGFVYRAPELDLGAPSVNATTTIAMPEGRWLLALRGPRLGPVVLYWSLLAIVLAVAGAVGWMRKTPIKSWQWMLFAIGLSQLSVVAAAIVVAWLHAVAWRERTPEVSAHGFNVRQLAIAGGAFVVVVILLVAVHQGLLGRPDMQVSGNGSYGSSLRWFTDRSGAELDAPVVVSAPMMLYRLAMLAWALWLALTVVRWMRWAFAAFGTGGFWKKPPPPPPVPLSPHRVPAHPAQQGYGPPPGFTPPAPPPPPQDPTP